MLAELQHHGAATCLIDFSFDALIALYFACCDQIGKEGAVIVLDYSNLEKVSVSNDGINSSIKSFLDNPEGKIWFWEPGPTNNRIIRQHSAFIFGTPSLDEALFKRFKISSDAKDDILYNLKLFHNIFEDTIFADLTGFAINNSQNRPYLSKSDRDLLLKGYDHCKNKKFFEAISFYSEYLKYNPKEISALLGRGYSYYYIEEYENALNDFTLAITINPEESSNYDSRGRVFLKINNYELAVQDFSKAIEISPYNKELFYFRGKAYFELKKFNECIQDFSKAFEIDLVFLPTLPSEVGKIDMN
jgi:tetratricopeptide (TPR) repeat protein